MVTHAVKQVIKIKLKAYDHKALDLATKEIVEQARRTGADVVGPIPLPMDKSVWSMTTSPHVDKEASEALEVRVHKRLIMIMNSNQETTNSLMKVDLAAGVDVEIKLEGDEA